MAAIVPVNEYAPLLSIKFGEDGDSVMPPDLEVVSSLITKIAPES